MTDKPTPIARSSIRREIVGIRRTLIFLALAMLFAILFFAKDLFVPITGAIVLAFVLRPIARAMGRIGIPPVVSAAAIVLVLAAAIVAGFYLLSEPAAQWLSEAPNIARQVEFKFRDLIQSASAVGDLGKQVKELAEGGDAVNIREVVVREPGLLTRAASGGANMAFSLLVAVVLLYFLLATADMLLEKSVQLLPRLNDKVRAVRVAREIEREISFYLFTVTIINFCLGASVAGALFLVGMPNPILWGLVAMLLNFLPYIGSILGALIIFAVSVVSFDTAMDAAAPPLIYLALTSLEGHFITPMVLGRRLDMNPVAIFLSVALWGWLWGPAGVVLAVPMMLMLKIAADHIEQWGVLSAYLSARSSSKA